MPRAAELAERLGMAAHRCTRLNADVAMLCEHALAAAALLREKADAVDSYDVAYVRRTLARMDLEAAGGQKEVARDIGISPSYLNDVILGRREPGPKVLKALGLERVATYRNEVMS